MKITMLENADIKKVDLVPAGAQQLSKITLMKSANKEDEAMDKVAKANLTDAEIEEVSELVNQLKAKLGLTEETEKAEDKPEEEVVEPEVEKEEDEDDEAATVKAAECTSDADEEAEVDKACGDNAVAKAALKKAADMEAENSQLKEKIEKMDKENIKKSFIAKASEMKNIPGVNDEELGEILMTVHNSCSEDVYKSFENILKSADGAIANGSLFVEKGTSSDDTGVINTKEDAWHAIEKIAESKVVKGTTTKEQAIASVLATPEGEALYNQYKSL